MGLLSNRVGRDELKPGDHIYSWRTAYIYAHHGIYVGDDTVIHFTRNGEEVGTGTVLDRIVVSSVPDLSRIPCDICTLPEEGSGVVSSCLNCFLAGGTLYRFEYSANPVVFFAKARGGTCTLAVSDSNIDVIHRAKYLFTSGFGCYNIFKNNCEDFAIYCKTGLLVVDKTQLGQSGQAASIIGGPLAAVVSTTLRWMATNVYGAVASGVWVYCAGRYAADSGKRSDLVKVSVEDLNHVLGSKSLPSKANEESMKEGELPDFAEWFKKTRFNSKTGKWATPSCEEIYNKIIQDIMERALQPDLVPLTHEEMTTKYLVHRLSIVKDLGKRPTLTHPNKMTEVVQNEVIYLKTKLEKQEKKMARMMDWAKRMGYNDDEDEEEDRDMPICSGLPSK